MASLTRMMTLLAYYFNSKVYIPRVLEASLATSDHVKLVTRQLQRFVKPDGYSHAVLLTFLKKRKKKINAKMKKCANKTESAQSTGRKNLFIPGSPVEF